MSNHPTTWILIDADTLKEIPIPSQRLDFRGDLVTITGIQPPMHSGSSGRIECTGESKWTNYWYPGVVNAKFIQATEEPSNG